MPRYFIVARTWAPESPKGPWRIFEAGDILEYAGVPGSSMVPLDAEGVKRMPKNRPHAEKMAKRYRRRLSRQDADKLAALESEIRRA